MKRLVSVAFLAAALLVPVVASAQPGYYGRRGPGYYAEPPGLLPGGYFDRMGRLALGFSLGLGGMSSNVSGDIGCVNCDYQPLAGEVDFHVGGMLTPRFALLFELQGNLQTVESHDAGTATKTLAQGLAMVAGQFWVTPHLWVKGGLGVADLSYDYESSSQSITQPIDRGVALLGAIGYEVYATREFAIDLQGRLVEGSYKGIDDQITSGTVGVGFNWY